MRMTSSAKRLAAVATSLVAATAYAATMTTGATAAPTLAPAATATIHPGVQMYTSGAQCTGNFVFTDAAGTVYVGYNAHCAGTGGATETDGCGSGSLPVGTRVTFNTGGSLLDEGTQVGTGTLAYSSWLTMQRSNEPNANTCAFNDLALVRVDDGYVDDVNPSVPFWGGPVGLDSDGTAAGDRVYSYGNSSLRAGVEVLSPKTGLSLGDAGGGWSHEVFTVSPGIPVTPAAAS